MRMGQFCFCLWPLTPTSEVLASTRIQTVLQTKPSSYTEEMVCIRTPSDDICTVHKIRERIRCFALWKAFSGAINSSSLLPLFHFHHLHSMLLMTFHAPVPAVSVIPRTIYGAERQISEYVGNDLPESITSNAIINFNQSYIKPELCKCSMAGEMGNIFFWLASLN
jgi:hypothetical protein